MYDVVLLIVVPKHLVTSVKKEVLKECPMCFSSDVVLDLILMHDDTLFDYIRTNFLQLFQKLYQDSQQYLCILNSFIQLLLLFGQSMIFL